MIREEKTTQSWVLGGFLRMYDPNSWLLYLMRTDSEH